MFQVKAAGCGLRVQDAGTPGDQGQASKSVLPREVPFLETFPETLQQGLILMQRQLQHDCGCFDRYIIIGWPQATGNNYETGTAKASGQSVLKLGGIIPQERYALDRETGLIQTGCSVAGIDIGNAATDDFIAGANNFSGKVVGAQGNIHFTRMARLSPA